MPSDSLSYRPNVRRARSTASTVSSASAVSATSTLSAGGLGVIRAYDFGENKDNLKFTWPQRIFLFFDDPSSSAGARAMSIFIMLLIVLSSISFVVETLPRYKPKPDEDPMQVFVWIEAVCIVCFSIEYLSRLLTAASFISMVERHAKQAWRVTVYDDHAVATASADETAALVAGGDVGAGVPPQQQRDEVAEQQLEVDAEGDGDVHHMTTCMALRYTWRFAKQILNVIDLLAIVPWYIELITVATSGGGEGAGGGLAVFRILRLARVFRVFKLGKYSAGMQTFGRVLTKSKDALYLMMFFVSLAVVLFGSMIYFAEAGSYDEATGKYMRPDKWGSGEEESPFTSIPASFWWVVVTTTTVGFGDLYPTTTAGKLVAAATMHVGILVLALPITIIGANFALEYEQDDDDSSLEGMDLMNDMLAPTPARSRSRRGSRLSVNATMPASVSQVPNLDTIVSAGSSSPGGSHNSSGSSGASNNTGSFHFGSNSPAASPQLIPPLMTTTTAKAGSRKEAKQRRRAELTSFITEMRQLCVKAETILQTATMSTVTSSGAVPAAAAATEAAAVSSQAATTSNVRLSDLVAANQ